MTDKEPLQSANQSSADQSGKGGDPHQDRPLGAKSSSNGFWDIGPDKPAKPPSFREWLLIAAVIAGTLLIVGGYALSVGLLR
ncbi:hypothetical protein ACFO5X_26090 [Seohaeicola nanhaiensis]|uniref:Uncharacterized protein n=1 Tax=Seohaeicola nanhaiensis TaxID=1387282 RepID=A0ABV9KR57_9RHOB